MPAPAAMPMPAAMPQAAAPAPIGSQRPAAAECPTCCGGPRRWNRRLPARRAHVNGTGNRFLRLVRLQLGGAGWRSEPFCSTRSSSCARTTSAGPTIVLTALAALTAAKPCTYRLPDAQTSHARPRHGLDSSPGDSYLSLRHATSHAPRSTAVDQGRRLAERRVCLKLRPNEPACLLEFGDLFRHRARDHPARRASRDRGARPMASIALEARPRVTSVVWRWSSVATPPAIRSLIPERGVHCGRERGDILHSAKTATSRACIAASPRVRTAKFI